MTQPDIFLNFRRLPSPEQNSYIVKVQFSWGVTRDYTLEMDFFDNFYEWERRVVRYIRAFVAWGNSGKPETWASLPIEFITDEAELDELQDLIERGGDTVENLGAPQIVSITHYDCDGDAYSVTYDEV